MTTTPELKAAGAAVIRALDMMGETFTYSEWAEAIGLLGTGETWRGTHRSAVSTILHALGREQPTLPFHVIVNSRTRKPGAGYYKEQRT